MNIDGNISAMRNIKQREPKQVMRLARLGSFHQSRLSFMRILTRFMARENWRFVRNAFEINERGEGYAVYTAYAPQRCYSLIAFAHDLPPEKRSDRVIAEAWDATFTLFDGIPTQEDIDRLKKNIPLQEAGRVSESELSVSRANRSVRLWEYLLERLASGQQPLQEEIDKVGYLMRTTAVYGSGKFGAADREMIADRPEFRAPFQAEMLSVYLTRWFVRDLVQHMADIAAQAKGSQAARLSPDIARSLGIGNSTGLGMAPFLLKHPILFNNWIAARENAIHDVRNVKKAGHDEIRLFNSILERSKASIKNWESLHPLQIEKLNALRHDVQKLNEYLEANDLQGEYPWDELYLFAENNLSLEGQEWIVSLMLEPYGRLVDQYGDEMSADNTATFRIAGAMKIEILRSLIEDIYAWALKTDWRDPVNRARAWYVSEEKLEPRLGERFEEPIEDYEQPLAPARDVAALYQALEHWPSDVAVAEFLLRHPEYRHILRRVQIVGRAPYAEIRDNTISNTVMPIDMLRCKLSFFGATKFDPRSDRWVRICMYGNAPYPEELTIENADFWVYPPRDRGHV